ncbi:MAG: hypothetical protein FJW96_17750, partial [Actinobacteria bacterium]|nr:hypothetical protein [Actinomycetota bacterium]
MRRRRTRPGAEVADLLRLEAVDLHACGEPGRVIVGGVDDVPGASIFEKMAYLREHRDGIRKLMLREPRGYPAANCNLVLPPCHPDADAGFVIMEQVEYPGMSGTNTICVVTALIETGRIAAVEPVTELTLETPAGLIRVRAEVRDDKVVSVTFRNVPAFAVHLDMPIEVPTLGTVTVDVAWGGMFYVLTDASVLDVELVAENGAEIARVCEIVKKAAQEQLPVEHPENPGLGGITIGQLYGPSPAPGVSRRNGVVVSTGEVAWNRPDTWTGALDRSPCGTGTCAAMACLHAKGLLGLEEDFVHESVIGTRFTGRLV